MRFQTSVLIVGCSCAATFAQNLEIRPQVVGRPLQEGQVTTVFLAPRYATAIRMPDAINSVVVGDPEAFSAEHSDREPQFVFVKPITPKPARTNLLISTIRGYQANLLLVSDGEAGEPAKPKVDFLMRYRPTGRFIIEPSEPAANVIRTVAAPATSSLTPREQGTVAQFSAKYQTESSSGRSDLEVLLERQRRAPLPILYGEKPAIAPAGREILKTGVSEVIDQGREVVVLFSVVNLQDHAVELMPPQVQLGGKTRKGKLFRRSVWSNSEQLPVGEFRFSRRRIGPSERADGVLVFERPGFKQSNETLLLQIADSGAVDRPALAPIGFGISSIREAGGTE